MEYDTYKTSFGLESTAEKIIIHISVCAYLVNSAHACDRSDVVRDGDERCFCEVRFADALATLSAHHVAETGTLTQKHRQPQINFNSRHQSWIYTAQNHEASPQCLVCLITRKQFRVFNSFFENCQNSVLDHGDNLVKSSAKLDRRQNVLSRQHGTVRWCRLTERSCRRPALPKLLCNSRPDTSELSPACSDAQ